jgi:amino acid transporter
VSLRAPISGGQYHWVSEFAPPKYQKFLSYVTGWMSTLSWQAGNASGSFLTGTIIQALLVVNYPDYSPENWQGTLFVFAMVLILYIVNIWGAQLWPKIQNALMVMHVVAFLVVIIVLWVMAPHQDASNVFTGFTNEGGWGSMGLSLMVGQITAIYALLGMSIPLSQKIIQTLTTPQGATRPPTWPKKSATQAATSRYPSSGPTSAMGSWP